VLNRARPAAIGVDDAEESQPAFCDGAQLMRFVGRDIDNIEVVIEGCSSEAQAI
jgi:hypothetical protein